ncbi:MAG TPA: zf-HC2 domain-containing protein, partial [Terracidiphilus sp.]|nr:zf-HC2 domain-containing protein [Terracidiphilus sp.]
MSDQRHSVTHPDADQLNAFISGALSEEARRDSLAHLAECAECRRIVFLAQAAVPQATAQKSAAKPWTRWVPAFALAGATVAAVLAAVVWMHPHSATRPMEPQVAVARPPSTAVLPPPQAPALAANGPAQPTMKDSRRERRETMRATQSVPQAAANALQQARTGVTGGVVGALSAGPVAGKNSAPQRQE